MPSGLLNNIEKNSLLDFNIRSLLKLARKFSEKFYFKKQISDLENAVDYYNRVIKLDSENGESYYALSLLLWESSQIDISVALKQTKKALGLAPEDYNAYLAYSFFLSEAGFYYQAVSRAKKAVCLNPLSVKARLMLGVTLMNYMNADKNRGHLALASGYYILSAITVIPFDFKFISRTFKSTMFAIRTAILDLKGVFLNMIHKYDEAVSNYEYAARTTRYPSKFYSKAAEIFIKTGSYDEAVSAYRKALAVDSGNMLLWAKLTAILRSYCSDRVDDLIECYNKLLSSNEYNSRIFYELGHLYISKNDKFSALNAFKRALEIEPENPFYRNSLAYAYVQLRHYDEALSEYKKAIKLNPDNKWTSIVCQAQGSIYHQIFNNLDAAIISYETAVVLDPENVDAYYALGEIYYQNGDVNSAIENYCEALRIKGDDSKIYCSLAKALWDKDCADEALIALDRSIGLEPENWEAQLYKGSICLDDAGDLDAAISALKSCLKYNPSSVLGNYNLGRAYQIIGLTSQAAEKFQLAYDLNKIKAEMEDSVIEEKLFNLFRL